MSTYDCHPTDVSRTWFFKGLCGDVYNEHFEHNSQQLPQYFYHPAWQFTGDLYSDHLNFIDKNSLRQLAGALAIAAVIANTPTDEKIRSWMNQQGLQEPDVDCWYSDLGDGSVAIPLVATICFLSDQWQQHRPGYSPFAATLENWSYRSLRAYTMGGAYVLVLQAATGASRPDESSAGSAWVPFADNNGVSGHAFVGAVPFLVASKMAKRPLVKAAFFAGSGLAGYGRLCNDSHYFSQVFLGWSIAYLSVEAATLTDRCNDRIRLVPLSITGYHGIGFEIRR